jgi:hypothetical protein
MARRPQHRRGFIHPVKAEELLDDAGTLPLPQDIDPRWYRDDAQEAFRAGAVDEAARLYFLCGYPYGMIARLVGYADWMEARDKINALLLREGRQKRTLRQNVEVARLNRYEMLLQPQAEDGNIEAISKLVEIGQVRRRILADDEPPRQAPPQLPWQEIERVLSTVAAIQGADPRLLMERFRTFAGQAGYLSSPNGTAGTVIEGEVEEGEEVNERDDG